MPAVRFPARSLLALAGAAALALPAAPEPSPADLALRKLRPAAGLQVSLFAAEPHLANPVSFSVDERGRFFVIESLRNLVSVGDLREHMAWLDDDFASRTVDDRVAMIRKRLGPDAGKLVDDTERLRMVEDRDGDGRADRAVVAVDGFLAPADGVAAGVLARGGDVWFADVPDLWLLRDADGDGRMDARLSLHHGFGVHIALLGHDLHGLRFGPDGKLYFSMGDRGLRVESEGRTIDCPDTGAVLRCDPDGSALELFATGLRNPQELAFDAHGNLWTGDNNADKGDKARWVYVVEGGDSGWRVGYQHAPGSDVWMGEKTWELEGGPPYRLPPVGYVGHGPSGIAFNPGTGLPARYDDHFFLSNFPGEVLAFAVKPKGASFEVVDLHRFLGETWPTDVDFGPGNGLYVLDWGEGWSKLGVGRLFRIFDPALEGDAAVREVWTLLRDGMAGRMAEETAGLLGHRDQRVRQAAQFALAGKGAGALPVLAAVAAGRQPGGCARPDLARLHAIWGIGQIGGKDAAALDALRPLLRDPDAEVRAQAAKALGERRFAQAYDEFVRLLKDESLRVRFFAAMGLGKIGRADAVGPILEMLRENADGDAYLRHAGVMGLVGTGDVEAIVKAGRDASAAVRMAALLALRRLERSAIAMFLNDPDPALVFEAARAIHDVPIPGAMPRLAELIAREGLPERALLRVIDANFRLGTSEGAAALAAFAARGAAAPDAMRVEALKALALWENPPGRDRIVNLHRPLPPRDAEVARGALAPHVESLLRDASDRVRLEAVRAVASLRFESVPLLSGLLKDRRSPPALRVEALRALAELGTEPLGPAVLAALEDPDEALRAEGVRLLPRAGIEDAAARLEALASGDGPLPVRRSALSALGALEGGGADAALVRLLDGLPAGRIPAAVQLDLLEAAAQRSSPEVRERLAHRAAARPKDDPLAAFREVLDGGDREAGRKVFFERADAGCAKCHRVGVVGGEVGSDLSAIGAHRTKEQLLDSILFPNNEIAAGYEQAVVMTKAEIAAIGRVESENGAEIVLIDAEGRRVRVAAADIQSRSRGKSAMPEGLGQALPLRDLRDLVAFLAGLGAEAAVEPGAVVVDDADADGRVRFVGTWSVGAGGEDFGSACRWAAPDPAGQSKMVWTAALPKAGRYRVCLWHGRDPNGDHATDAPFTVEHDGGTETFRVDLTRDVAAWRRLGTFPFGAKAPARVVLSNDASGNVVGDAVKWVPE